MSSETDSVVPFPVSTNLENPYIKAEYRKVIIGRVVQFVGLFYMVYGVFVAYVWTSKDLDVKSRNQSVINFFWDPVITTYSLGNLAVAAMIGVNKYWSFKAAERKIINRPDNHIIVCFMLIPLFISSSIYNIILLAYHIQIIPCHGYMTFLVPASTLTLISGAAVLIFDVGYFTARSADWRKEMMKRNLIFFTVIGVANCLIVAAAIQHMEIFRSESLNSSYGSSFKDDDFCVRNQLPSALNATFEAGKKYLRPTFILFCVCTIAYLMQPLLQSESDQTSCSNLTIQTSDDDDRSMSEENLISVKEEVLQERSNDHTVSYRLPSASLVLCITFLSLSFLSFIIMYSLRQNVNGKDKPNMAISPNATQDWHSELGSLIFCSFISIVYVIGSALSSVHIVEIKRWQILNNRRGKIIDKCLIWIGAGGQLALTITSISNAIVLLVNRQDNSKTLIALLVMLIFSSIFLIAQTFLQTIQVSLLLDRRWIRPEINSLAESLCPAVGMMGLNMGLLLLSVDQLKSPIVQVTSNIMFVDLFVRELRCIGETLCILQRLHASLLFASMIVYTHN